MRLFTDGLSALQLQAIHSMELLQSWYMPVVILRFNMEILQCFMDPPEVFIDMSAIQ